MSLRKTLEAWQVQWAERNGIGVGAPPGNAASKAAGYVDELRQNLFEPLSERVNRQLIAGAELNSNPDGLSGNMYAVYSSSALCVNCFHYWSQLLDRAQGRNSESAIDPMLTALALPAGAATSIDFEVPNVVNPRFTVAPHLDVRIMFGDGPWKCAGIEAKFCEPYGDQKPGGLNPVYLQQRPLWQGWPNIFEFARELIPNDLTHSHLHAAQLLKHLLGMRMQYGTNFVLLYLWFDVPGAEAAMRHRREIDSFGAVLRRDGVPFAAITYQDVFEGLRGGSGEPNSRYMTYLLERYGRGPTFSAKSLLP